MVGEQPGDAEGLEGHPFVGRAGQLLNEALRAAGIPRKSVYVTNAVKHFKWKPAGKRRLHKKPSAGEVAACRPWLAAELEVLRPTVLVCMGSTAAQSVMGKPVRIYEHRGEFIETPWAPWTMITVHPSSILRIPDREQRHDEYDRLVEDLKKVAAKLAELPTL